MFLALLESVVFDAQMRRDCSERGATQLARLDRLAANAATDRADQISIGDMQLMVAG